MTKVTVLMPVYNGEKYLREAIDSILSQTFTDFDFLIVDDGSIDQSLEIAKSYTDVRIKIIENVQNLGIITTLNKGLKIAKGKYIARMDSDDVCFPARLEKQVDFLDKHPEISIIGSNVQVIDSSSKRIKTMSFPTESELIKWHLFFCSPIAHPTVLARREVLIKLGGYNSQCQYVEDYELWLRASKDYKFENISEELLYYRLHDNNISVNHQQAQEKNASYYLQSYCLKSLNLNLSTSGLDMIRFKSERYDAFTSFNTLKSMYLKFIEIYFISKKHQYLVRQDICNRMLGIVKRDNNWISRIQGLLLAVKFDFSTMITLIYTKLKNQLF